jgi:hypothetical protein
MTSLASAATFEVIKSSLEKHEIFQSACIHPWGRGAVHLVHTDEGTSAIQKMTEDSKNVSILVAMLDGESVVTSTLKDGDIRVNKPLLNLALCAQPAILPMLNNRLCLLDGLRFRVHLHLYATVGRCRLNTA